LYKNDIKKVGIRMIKEGWYKNDIKKVGIRIWVLQMMMNLKNVLDFYSVYYCQQVNQTIVTCCILTMWCSDSKILIREMFSEIKLCYMYFTMYSIFVMLFIISSFFPVPAWWTLNQCRPIDDSYRVSSEQPFLSRCSCWYY
jgi:hypothetical protein